MTDLICGLCAEDVALFRSDHGLICAGCRHTLNWLDGPRDKPFEPLRQQEPSKRRKKRGGKK